MDATARRKQGERTEARLSTQSIEYHSWSRPNRSVAATRTRYVHIFRRTDCACPWSWLQA